MVVDENGQALSAFKHEITNIGQKPIKNIQWVGVYVNNRKVIYSQDMQINLETPLQPGKSININLQIPFVQLAEDARKVFMNHKKKLMFTLLNALSCLVIKPFSQIVNFLI